VGDFVVLHNQPGVNDCGHPPAKDRVHARSFGKGRFDHVIAANIDTVFIITAVGPDLKSRRIERYLANTHASGCQADDCGQQIRSRG
jgi:ribosome biogenesis GTPase